MKKAKVIIMALVIMCMMLPMAACSGSAGSDVEVTIPAGMINIMSSSENDSTAAQNFCDTMVTYNGIVSAEVNVDNSVTIIMTKEAQTSLLDSYKAAIDSMTGSFTSISSIEYNEDLTEINITVDADAFSESGESVSVYYTVMMYANYYMYFDGKDKAEFTINVIDNSDGSTIDTLKVPDDNDKLSDEFLDEDAEADGNSEE